MVLDRMLLFMEIKYRSVHKYRLSYTSLEMMFMAAFEKTLISCRLSLYMFLQLAFAFDSKAGL